jgi:hypothetical protein
LKANTIWVEHEIFHPDTGLLIHTLHDTSKLVDNGNVVWEFDAGKYRIYGLPDFQLGVSPEIFTPLRSSISAFTTPPVISVKTELDADNIIDLSDSFNEDIPLQRLLFMIPLICFPLHPM